ncbi:MAG TPA: DUF2865 domain-containing protein [Hyphomicrobiaceae bacterium]
MGTGGTPAHGRRLIAAAVCAALGLAATASEATAQWPWQWPWSKQDDSPPVPREPMRQPRGQPPPDQLPPFTPGGQPPPHPPYASQGGGYQDANNICLQLERRLVSEVQGSGQGREMLPKIEADIRDLERSFRLANIRLDRSDCWDTFLFSKTLKRRPDCRQLNDDVENMRQRLADLDRQRRQIMGEGDRRSLQDDIIRELARNGCGQQYVQEARKRDNASNPFAMLFGGGEDSEAPRGPANNFGNLPFATYRTLCVRLCDGYYFPVSFSTLPNHFQRDSDVCHAQCAAPAELYYHQNPGGAVEQMVSASSQQPYTSLKSAFRYRKEYVPGCSCKQAEYDPGALEKRAEAPAPAAAPAPAPAVPPAAAGVRVGSKR